MGWNGGKPSTTTTSPPRSRAQQSAPPRRRPSGRSRWHTTRQRWRKPDSRIDMANGYSRSPKLLKGALIQFSAPLLIPIPNLIVFQYNPETLSRSLNPWAPPEKDDEGKIDDKILNKLAQPYDPQETFTLNLEVDATDALENPGSHPVEFVSGVADRIAAMEMLLYPPGDSALGGLLNV